MPIKILSNVEDIELTLTMLTSNDPANRYFAAETLGDIGRSKNSHLQRKVLAALLQQSELDDSSHVRRVAARSIKEINGEFDETWEKYKPQEPRGTLRDQYYLKRG